MKKGVGNIGGLYRVFIATKKKVFSLNYGSNTCSWKLWRWVRLDLIFMMRDIYINSNLDPLTKFTSSRRSTEFRDILPWNISQMIMKTIPISTRIVISYAVKWNILFWVWQKISGNWENNIRISQWRVHYRTNSSIRRNKSIQISRTVRVTVRDLCRKDYKLIIWFHNLFQRYIYMFFLNWKEYVCLLLSRVFLSFRFSFSQLVKWHTFINYLHIILLKECKLLVHLTHHVLCFLL